MLACEPLAARQQLEDLIDFSIPCPEDTHPNVGFCPGWCLIVPLKDKPRLSRATGARPLGRAKGVFGISRIFSHLVGFWDPLTPDDSSHQLSATSLLPNFHQKQLIFARKKKTKAKGGCKGLPRWFGALLFHVFPFYRGGGGLKPLGQCPYKTNIFPKGGSPRFQYSRKHA